MLGLSENEVKLFKKKYTNKVNSTKGRVDKNGQKIEMLLTLEDYIKLYKNKGVLPSREYVLSRCNDEGSYALGNVFVQHNLQNLCDAAGKTSDLDLKINQYCIENDYSRRIVKSLLKRGVLSF
jgi:hypothetical protein